jgi:hypothetical protein
MLMLEPGGSRRETSGEYVFIYLTVVCDRNTLVPFGRTANEKEALDRSMRIAYSTRSLFAVPVREG